MISVVGVRASASFSAGVVFRKTNQSGKVLLQLLGRQSKCKQKEALSSSYSGHYSDQLSTAS